MTKIWYLCQDNHEIYFSFRHTIEADGIIAWHPDRLSRNEIDAATITYMIRTGAIKDLKFGSYYFDNSPEGIMMLQNALSHSQYSSSKLSVDTKRGLRTKAEIGWYSGVAKFGYLNNKFKDKGEKDIYPDPDRFKIARRMWDLMLTGLYSPPQILKIANEDWGVRTVKRKKLVAVLCLEVSSTTFSPTRFTTVSTNGLIKMGYGFGTRVNTNR